MLKIIQAPNTILSQKSKAVSNIDSIQQLLNQMERTLDSAHDPEGVGLAAPQIGKSAQIFIVRQTPRSPLLTFINPFIESTYDKPSDQEQQLSTQNEETTKAKEKAKISRGVQLEGCLSVHNIWGVVKRKHGVVLSYQDEKGVKHKKKFDGFLATIIQHECDHLQGILFPKRVLEQKNQLYRSSKNTKGEIEFEEIEL